MSEPATIAITSGSGDGRVWLRATCSRCGSFAFIEVLPVALAVATEFVNGQIRDHRCDAVEAHS